MNKDTDFEFGWNEADNLAPPWSAERASAGTGRRTAQQASAVPASDPEFRQTGHGYDCECSRCAQVELTCDVVLKIVRSVTTTARKGNRMAIDLNKYYNEKKASGNGNFKRNPFLKPENIPAKGLTCKILGLREAQSGFSDLLMDVIAGKKEYTVGLKRDSVLLGQLVQHLTAKDSKWTGKTVTFVLAKGKYINLQPSK